MIDQFDVIIDVRGASSYEQGHVRGAILQSRIPRNGLDGCETRKVAFYCSVGSASESAASRYARSSSSSQSYAIGTLDDLQGAGVQVESGMPSDHNPRCPGTTSSQASDSTFVYVLAGVGGILGALLVVRPM